MTTLVPSTLLRAALVLDAIGTGAVALLQLGGLEAVARRTGIPEDLLYGTGIFMVGYVALLVVLATRPRLPAWLVGTVVLGNAAWALGAIGLGVGADWPLSGYGVALLAVHAVAVASFAALQYLGMRRSHGATGGRPAHAV